MFNEKEAHALRIMIMAAHQAGYLSGVDALKLYLTLNRLTGPLAA